MKIYSLLMYIIFSIILSCLLNKITKEKEENLFDYIVVSNIYILILSGIFPHHSTNIFLVVLFQTIGDLIYLTYIKEVTNLNNSYNVTKYLLNVVLSYLLNILFINKTDSIFLDIEQIKLIIWILIMIYLYFNIKDNIKINNNKTKQKLYYQDDEYIVMQYAKYKNKYNNIIVSKKLEISMLVYAMMIYENYNRPKLMRKYDELKYKIFPRPSKFGIMQINSSKYLSDVESINISLKKIEKLYSKSNDINKIIKSYYKSNKKEVINIYKRIVEFNKK